MGEEPEGPRGHAGAPAETPDDETRGDEYVPVVLSDHEAARARAVSVFLAAQADDDPAVQAARRVVTGTSDATLPQEQAWALLASPAVRYLPKRAFLQHDIPLVGHRAEVLGDTANDHVARSNQGVSLCITWPQGQRVEVVRPPDVSRSGWDNWLTSVEVPDPAGGSSRVIARRGSVLDQLGRWSRELARRYPWRPEQSLWFLLTGEPPEVMPLVVTVTPYHDQTPPRIRIEADPWVSSETILRTYREVQHRLLGGRSRPTGDRLVTLLAFVATHRLRQERATWRALLPVWNADHPEWAYGDVRNFAAEARRAEMLLLPPYGSRPSQPSASQTNEEDTQ